VRFDSRTIQIFFDAPFNKDNIDVFEFYKGSKYLSFEPPQGYTVYPPLSALGQTGHKETNIFRFKTHPHLSFKFIEGELIIENRKSEDQGVYNKPFIKLLFDTEEQSDSAYKKLVEEFTKLSTRKRIDSNQDPKSAEFTDDHSALNKEITIWQGKAYNLPNPYVITIWLENEMDSDS
jgi:hypothetical protein